jgi:hypothetical protein
MRLLRTLSVPLLALYLASSAGCAKHESAVTGSVTLDGVPLSRGTVTFHPREGGAAAYARIDADGRYTLKTGAEEGLKPGKYVATVVATAPPGPGESETAVGKLLIPARYGMVEQSGLEYTITTGKNQVDIPLKSN